MKRRFDLCERDNGTPRASSFRTAVQVSSGRTQKRPKHVRALLSTPSFGSPQVETPESERIRQAAYEPSTAERKLAGISLTESPIFGVAQVNILNSKTDKKTELSRFASLSSKSSTETEVQYTQGTQDDNEDEDDYNFIRCSQTYARVSSQVCEPYNTPHAHVTQAHLPPNDSQEASQFHFSLPVVEHTEVNPVPVLDVQHENPLSAPQSQLLDNSQHPAAADTTPELNDSTTATSLAEEGGTHGHEVESHGMKMFPIFRPRAERKTLLIIRHGESEYNKAATELGGGFADPRIFDPKLTSRGRSQASNLKNALKEHIDKLGEPLWVVSPLTRCIETFLHACPFPERLCLSSRSSATAEKPLNIEILSCISEHVASCGDVGRPPSELAKDFPQLASRFKGLKEQWWATNNEKPNCAMSKMFNTYETKEQLRSRVTEFERWLSRRHEKFVILVGHSTFWKEFTKEPKRLRNGECLMRVW